MKVFFGRQEFASDAKIAMVDRALTDQAFQIGRRVAVMLHNVEAEQAEYGAGVSTNGVFARAGYRFGDIKGYNEGDFEGGPLRFAIGAGALYGFAQRESTVKPRGAYTGSERFEWMFTGDGVLKVNGFSLSVGYIHGIPVAGELRRLVSFGGYGQLGYVIESIVELMFRYSFVRDGHPDPSIPTLAKIRYADEILGGAAVYAWGHDVKVVVDGGVRRADAYDVNALHFYPVVRGQLQVGF
jgi:hypothetical protein